MCEGLESSTSNEVSNKFFWKNHGDLLIDTIWKVDLGPKRLDTPGLEITNPKFQDDWSISGSIIGNKLKYG